MELQASDLQSENYGAREYTFAIMSQGMETTTALVFRACDDKRQLMDLLTASVGETNQIATSRSVRSIKDRGINVLEIIPRPISDITIMMSHEDSRLSVFSKIAMEWKKRSQQGLLSIHINQFYTGPWDPVAGPDWGAVVQKLEFNIQ
jgi:hypothetical protein